MRSRLVCALFVLLTLLPLGAGCGAPPARPVGPLAEALALVPAAASELGFTDWARIKAYLGVSGLTGQS